jgi:hypothetical protein
LIVLAPLLHNVQVKLQPLFFRAGAFPLRSHPAFTTLHPFRGLMRELERIVEVEGNNDVPVFGRQG